MDLMVAPERPLRPSHMGIRMGLTPEGAYLWPLTAPQSPPPRGLAPAGQIKGLGMFGQINPQKVAAGVAIALGAAVAGVGTLSAWANFRAIALPKQTTFWQVVHGAVGALSSLAIIEGILVLIGGIAVASGGIEQPRPV